MGEVNAQSSKARVQPKVGGLVCAFLQRATTRTLIPMMSARQRWHLLIEVMLGHPPVRGGRARDYPFSRDRLESCKIAKILMESQRTFKVSAECTLAATDYDFIVALRCVALAPASSKPSGSVDEERHFSAGIRYLIGQYLMDAESEAADLLGLGGKDTNDQKPWRPNSPQVKAALLFAGLASQGDRPEAAEDLISYVTHSFCPSGNALDLLSQSRLTLLSMQSKKVQELIDRCELPFVQRGASYWVSQNMSRIREHLIESVLPTSALLLDNEAKTVLVLAEGGTASIKRG